MYRKIICAVVLCTLMVSTASTASALEDTEKLEQQITALEKYVTLHTQQNTITNFTPLSDQLMGEIITNGVAWLRSAQEESGHFAYEYVPYEDTYLRDDNIVRQAGALYALGEVVRRSQSEDKETNKVIEKAIGFFENQSPEHSFEGETIRCVTNTLKSKTCKLGATALALTGILGYVEAHPNKKEEYEDLIEGYKDYILVSKKPTEGFRNEYSVGKGFRSEAESSFSNGEALLALVRYYQYTENEEVKKVAHDTFVYLESTPFDTALYLWIMAALKDMNTLWPNVAYTTYGKEFTAWRMGMVSNTRVTMGNSCASTEGLASAYSLLEKTASDADKNKLLQEITFWNKKNSLLQVQEEDVYRVVIHDGKVLLPRAENITQSVGGFLTGHAVPTQRIDYTQHCVTAYTQTLVDINAQKL